MTGAYPSPVNVVLVHPGAAKLVSVGEEGRAARTLDEAHVEHLDGCRLFYPAVEAVSS